MLAEILAVPIRCLLAAIVLLALGSPAFAQFKEKEGGKGVRYGEEQTKKYRAGLVITARGGAVKNVRATVPVPFEWPEQEVRVVQEDLTPQVKQIDYRMNDGTVRQMLVEIPLLTPEREGQAILTFEVKRRRILAPSDTSIFVIPKRPPREVMKYLGPSPYIESRSRTIIDLAKETIEGQDQAWKKVEAIYDKVREKVEYKDSELKGALAALRDGHADCEDLTSLFIAMCRAVDVPARTVWVPGHCYPEFYLQDDDGQGHWFPCQAAGTRAFGEMTEPRPILQKGDNFKVPEKPKPQRYVAEYLKGLPAGGTPKVKWIREMVD